ncbi:MFS general substrate transporter [Marasmius fiardii PR-910]|nr:MFS general substrate transporter [Marasmius fiardii PR-910]
MSLSWDNTSDIVSGGSEVTKDLNSQSYQKYHLDKEAGSGQDDDTKPEVVRVDERKTMLYIDFRILPILALTFAISLIDRINLGSALVAGMGADLDLQVGNRYSVVTALYFVPFILLEIPANAFLRRIGVRYMMTFIVIAWGAVQLAMGFVKHWGFLVLCRVLIGTFEAGFSPAMVFVMSTWYKRHEVQKRLAVFWVLSGVIAGFGPILAYALSLLNGKQNITGWSWIFIIEGAITLVIGILVYFFIPDFPDRNTFLTEAQTTFVLRRIEDDRGDSIPDEITARKVLHHLSDWTNWVYGTMLACSSLPAYMLTLFLPTILKGMDFTTAQSLLLCFTVMFFAWISDRMKHRAAFICIQALMTLSGCSMTAFGGSTATRFAGKRGTQSGLFGANNVLSHSKRSVQSAVTITGSGIGGIIASSVFRQQDSPKYLPGLWVTIGAQILCIVLAVMMSFRFYILNRLSKEGRLGRPLEGQVGFLYTT